MTQQQQCNCDELIGELSNVEEGLVGELTNPIEYIYPELENLEITPTTEEQHFKSDKYGYNEVLVHKVEGQDIQIKPSLEEQNFKGLYANITVDPIESEEINFVPSTETQVKEGMFNKVTVEGDKDLVPENIKEGVNLFGVEGTGKVLDIKITDASYLFYGNARAEYMNEILALCENITNASYMFYQCSFSNELPIANLDTSNVKNMTNMFNGCYYKEKIDVSNFDTSNVQSLEGTFQNCYNVTELDVRKWNVSNVGNIVRTFSSCNSITELDLSNWDLSKVSRTASFIYCNKLTVLKSFKNLGKNFSQKTNNYTYHSVDIQGNMISRESLLDVITNGLYDLNLTYDVANGGTLYTQTLRIGSTNLAKLTAEEIAIATSRGWNVT